MGVLVIEQVKRADAAVSKDDCFPERAADAPAQNSVVQCTENGLWRSAGITSSIKPWCQTTSEWLRT